MQTIRTELLLGGNKVIVGNKYTDLVLETLGKVYIKTGNKSVVLDNLIKSLMDSDSNSEIIFTNSTNEMLTMEYPGDGRFVYNKLTNTLYISLDSRYIQLIEASIEGSSRYVKKQGDTMSGLLEINTIGAPLIVASSLLVKNFNALYLNSYSSDDFAKKRLDEIIYGSWSFDGLCYANNNWIFKENTRFYKDIVTSGSLSSPLFAGGFGGYGWMLDSNTNTLTIDNLVVRKAMLVYEMVINLISATNGSLWVSNSTKIEKVYRPYLITKEELDAINTGTKEEINAKLNGIFWNNNYFLVTDLNLTINQDTNNLGTSTELNIGFVTESKSLSSANNINTIPKEFVNFKYVIWIGDLNKVLDDENFPGVSAFYDENYLFNVNTNLDLKAYYLSKEILITEWNEDNTPKVSNYLSTFNKSSEMFIKPRDSQEVVGLKPYYKYFALSRDLINSALTLHVSNGIKQVPVPTIYIIDSDSDMNPTLKSGDIIRCLKFEDNNIKYYDAIVTSQFKSKSYILLKASSIFDTYTEVNYSDTGEVESRTEVDNSTLYNKTEYTYNPETGEYENNYPTTERIADVAALDDLIQMGNIYNTLRQNAIYITSTDDLGPYIDIMSGLNRPDYSVIYDLPVYKKIKVFIKLKGNIFVLGEPYDYYYQKENPQAVNFNQKPTYISGNTKKYPLVYITVDEKLNTTGTYINDGETNNIPEDTLQGYFITNYPTLYSIKEENSVTGTKITKVRLGNLDGIYNPVFKTKQPYGFGLYGENVFLTGEFYLNNGKSVVEFTLDEVNIIQGELDKLWTAIQLNSKDILLLANKIEDINGSITTMSSEIKVNADNIAAQTSRIDSINNTITNSGWITSADSIRIFTELVNALGIAKTAEIKTYVNDLIAGIRLTADLIEFEGYTIINNNFRVDELGNMTAVNATLNDCFANNFTALGTFQTNNNGDRIIISSSSNSIEFRSGNTNTLEMFFYDYNGLKSSRINLNVTGGETMNLSPNEFYLFVHRPEIPMGNSSSIEIKANNLGINIKNLTSTAELFLTEDSILFRKNLVNYNGLTKNISITDYYGKKEILYFYKGILYKYERIIN